MYEKLFDKQTKMTDFPKQDIDKLIDLVDTSKNITIVTHVNPDGDAIGSVIAWSSFLKERGINSTIISPNPFPDFLKWINKSEEILIYSLNKKKTEEILKCSDLLFCLDFNSLSRLDRLGNFIETIDVKKILIDHHINPKKEDFTVSFSKVPISSTCEIVYNLIAQISGSKIVSQDIAEAIYTGMLTDTGAFAHSTNADLFRIVADLIDCGVDQKKTHSLVYNNFSEHRMRLMSYSIYNKMVVLPEYKTAYISLTRNELDEFKYEPGDTEGFVNIPLSIKDIAVSVLFMESKDGYIKISFRSVGDFSVDSLSRRHFNGGGHKNASGGKSFSTMEETISHFLNILPEYKNEL